MSIHAEGARPISVPLLVLSDPPVRVRAEQELLIAKLSDSSS